MKKKRYFLNNMHKQRKVFQQMKLAQWIKKTGPKTVAILLSVDPSTVSGWRTARAFPRPHHLKTIHQLSKGKVTYEEMVEDFNQNQKRHN